MRANPLSLDFLAQKPGAAARVLQNLNAEEAALYLSVNIPLRVVAPVIERIETWPAARILELMPLDKSSGVLKLMQYPVVAAVMRLFEESYRQELLEQLPSQLVKTLTRSLSYREDTVGAWMENLTPAFSGQLTVGECLGLLKKSRAVVELVVVIDDSHRIEGIISLGTLLVNDVTRKLASLATSRLLALAAQSSLAMAKEAPGWVSYGALPIRDNNDVFIGTISREALLEALLASKPKLSHESGDSLITHLASAMLATVSGLLTMNSVRTADAPRRGKSHDRNIK
jgi:Mg/Co/Ni transporter MgtE